MLKAIRNLFYWSIDNKVVYTNHMLQTESISDNQEEVLLVDKSNESHLEAFIDIFNDAYGGGEGEKKFQKTAQVRSFLDNHLFLQEVETFFFLEKGEAIGMFSVGAYKENSTVGGFTAIAIKRAFQGRGYGKQLLQYGLGVCRQRGFDTAQSIIASKRRVSLFSHFACGFRPMYSGYVFAQGLRNTNLHQRLRLKLRLCIVYRNFKKKERKKL